MSKISTRIRAYVNDPSVADDYGKWGALRPDQRRQIRELCDTCDEFERTADSLMQERREIFAEIDNILYGDDDEEELDRLLQEEQAGALWAYQHISQRIKELKNKYPEG